MKNTCENFQALITTIRALLGDNGCPWDKKQTNLSLLKYFKLESEELQQAIQNNDSANICEELGDLFYILVMMSEINAAQGIFTLNDVIMDIEKKLIRRHPHVFAGKTYANEDELKAQWQAIKAEEKKKNSI